MTRLFTDILRELCGGRTVDDLGERLQEIVGAVIETHKVGKLTLELTVRPNGEHAVVVADKITTKIPELTRGDSVFFVAGTGDLIRNDPRQPDLPLRRVSEPTEGKVVTHG